MKDTPDKLAAIYIKMREAIQEKEEEIKTIKAQQEKVTQEMLALCEEQNIDSLRTPSDWDKMHDFIKENDALHLLEKRVHTSNMKEYLEANPDVAPPGLQTNRKYTVSVLKPRKK